MPNLFKKVLMGHTTFLIIMNSVIFAQPKLNSTGIGLRGSFYNPSTQNTGVSYSTQIGRLVNKTVNLGGCLYLFSRISEKSLLEFSIGNFTRAEEEISYIASHKVDAWGMTSILFGLRYEILQLPHNGILLPYLNGGFAVYIFSDVKVLQELRYEQVEVFTNVKPGLYLAIGLNIQVRSWIALNLDGKYHFVNINPDYPYSGFEFGMGFNFSWGSFEK